MKKKIVLVFGFLLIIGGIIWVYKTIKITNITCKNQYGKCDVNLQLIINNLQKGNIFETRRSLDKLLKEDKSVEKYAIKYQFPTSYNIDVVEKKPVMAVNLGKESDLILVDKDGIVLAKVKTSVLPKVMMDSLIGGSKLIYIADLVSDLYTFYGIKLVYAKGDGIYVEGLNNKEVIFPVDGDKEVLLGSLALILSRLPSVKEASTIKIIDLRFKNPVLK